MAQADALEIESLAKRRLADAYDEAQERGELVSQGRPKNILDENVFTTTLADAGLTAKEIYEARQIRDAEEADPGIVRRTLDALLEAGEEPTKAAQNGGGWQGGLEPDQTANLRNGNFRNYPKLCRP